jgi:hypothetical protein
MDRKMAVLPFGAILIMIGFLCIGLDICLMTFVLIMVI